jgi:hypothetical protein
MKFHFLLKKIDSGEISSVNQLIVEMFGHVDGKAFDVLNVFIKESHVPLFENGQPTCSLFLFISILEVL